MVARRAPIWLINAYYTLAAQAARAPGPVADGMGVAGWGVWMLCALFAVGAGIMDWRSRRIPNWWTVPGLGVGIAVNAALRGWPGTKDSLLGAGLGLLLLLPFLLVRSLGAGDWKLVGALGAFLGPRHLLETLFVTVLVAGLMAVILVIAKRRVKQTLRNLGAMLGALFSFHLPGAEVSLDNPASAKVPFGVAVAVAVVFCGARQLWRVA